MAMTKDELNALKTAAQDHAPKNWIRVGYSTCGVAAGAREVFEVLVGEIKARNMDIAVKKCGCVGLCSAEPLVEVNIDGAPRVFYGKVNKDVAHRIMDEHVCQKKLVENHIYEI
ncbi:MAG: (2Fe-2S) ferredoxin domain-containing protein [Candidatus Omnitrophota bacterium]